MASRTVKGILWWTLSVIWTAVIYLTLPYAPVWRDWLTEKFTGYFIPVTVAVILLAIMIITIVRMIRYKSSVYDYILLALVIYGYYFALSRIEIIVEQVHFLEYGLLAYLVIRALRVSNRSLGQYLNALLLVSLAGIIDECIQGQLPNRVGELRDVYTNILSAALALLWYRYGLHPQETRTDWRKILRVAFPVMGIIALSIGIFNKSVSDFGNYIADDETGDFYTRLSLEEARCPKPDSSYFKQEVLSLLYQGDYGELLNAVQTPVHEEVLVHIYRRDKRLQRGYYCIAYKENLILEKYFSCYISGTKHRWTEEFESQVLDSCKANMGEHYISPVSQHLITDFSESAQWRFIAVLEVILLGGWILTFYHRRQ